MCVWGSWYKLAAVTSDSLIPASTDPLPMGPCPPIIAAVPTPSPRPVLPHLPGPCMHHSHTFLLLANTSNAGICTVFPENKNFQKRTMEAATELPQWVVSPATEHLTWVENATGQWDTVSNFLF